MTNSRPIRSNIIAAHERLTLFLSEFVSPLTLNEVLLNKLLIVILIIAISNLFAIWRLNLHLNYLRSLQHIVSTNYVTLTIFNNTIRLPSQSDSLYMARTYCLSAFTLMQLYTLFFSLIDHQTTNIPTKIDRISAFHTGFIIQCCLLPGCWELTRDLLEAQKNVELAKSFGCFIIAFFIFWVLIGYIIFDGPISQKGEQVSEEEKELKDRQFANAYISVLSIDTILLICTQYA